MPRILRRKPLQSPFTIAVVPGVVVSTSEDGIGLGREDVVQLGTGWHRGAERRRQPPPIGGKIPTSASGAKRNWTARARLFT
jgi:hypothetical protein